MMYIRNGEKTLTKKAAANHLVQKFSDFSNNISIDPQSRTVLRKQRRQRKPKTAEPADDAMVTKWKNWK